MRKVILKKQEEEPVKDIEILMVQLLEHYMNTERGMSHLYDSTDVKRLLNISDKTLYRLRTNKEISFFKLGRKYFYPKIFFETIGK